MGLLGCEAEVGAVRRPSEPMTVALTLAEVPPTLGLPPLFRGAGYVPARDDGEDEVVDAVVVLMGGGGALEWLFILGAGVMVMPLGKEGLELEAETSGFGTLPGRVVATTVVVVTISAATFLMGLERPSRAESEF